MAYPPSVPPSNRLATNPGSLPAQDHDQLTIATQAIITELGSSPKGSASDLSSRLSAIEGSTFSSASKILWGIGDEITGSTPSAQTTAIYQKAPRSMNLVSAWYNGASDLGFFTGISRSSIDSLYAQGKAIEVIIWLANDTAYAISDQFLSIDLPKIVDAYKGAGPTYFVLFTELETYYDKATLVGRQYRDSLKTQYIKACDVIRNRAPYAQVGLGFTGQFWSGSVGTTRNLKYYQDGVGSTQSGSTQDDAVVLDAYTSADALAYSDFLCSQQMQGAVTFNSSGKSLLINQIINQVNQFNTMYPFKPIAISHFKVWDDPKSGGVPVAGADINAQNTWGAIMDDLFTETQFSDFVKKNLIFWNFMTDHYINLTGVIQDRTAAFLNSHGARVSEIAQPIMSSDILTIRDLMMSQNRRLTGWESIPRQSGVNSIGMTSGTAKFVAFTPLLSFSCTQIEIGTGNVAGATITAAKVALHKVNVDGSLTRLAVSASDTSTRFQATNTRYTIALGSTVSIVAGQRYAVEVFITGTTMPQFTGMQIFAAAAYGASLGGDEPKLGFNGPASQTDSLSSYTTAQLTGIASCLYTVLLP